MKVWITKYALTRGIIEAEGEPYDPEWIFAFWTIKADTMILDGVNGSTQKKEPLPRQKKCAIRKLRA